MSDETIERGTQLVSQGGKENDISQASQIVVVFSRKHQQEVLQTEIDQLR
ncbi:hypothetical protein HYR54_10040 [Candidatus Acetothermia bacterium]|nr:hypothetical protein [Candidatus Acetothermia bacterium]